MLALIALRRDSNRSDESANNRYLSHLCSHIPYYIRLLYLIENIHVIKFFAKKILIRGPDKLMLNMLAVDVVSVDWAIKLFLTSECSELYLEGVSN